MSEVTKLLNAAQIAEILGMTESSVYHYSSRCPEKLPPSMHLGRKMLRWHPDIVKKWLEEKAGINPE